MERGRIEFDDPSFRPIRTPGLRHETRVFRDKESRCQANGTHRPPCPCVERALREMRAAARELIADLEARGPLFLGDAAGKLEALKEAIR